MGNYNHFEKRTDDTQRRSILIYEYRKILETLIFTYEESVVTIKISCDFSSVLQSFYELSRGLMVQ